MSMVAWCLQKEEDNIVTLLDDESRAVLGLLQRGAAPAVAPPPVLPLRPSYQSDLTNRPAKVIKPLVPTTLSQSMKQPLCSIWN